MNNVYCLMGDAYQFLKKDNAIALKYYQKSEAVSQDLNDHPAYWAIFHQGEIARSNKNFEEALRLFKRAAGYGQQDWWFQSDLYNVMGDVYRYDKKDNATALGFYKKSEAASKDLGNGGAYWAIYHQAEIARDNKNIDEALRHAKRVEAYGKHDWTFRNDLYYLLGEIYRYDKKDNATALDYYKQSETVSQDLKDWPAYWAIYRQGEIAYESAVVLLKKAEQYGKQDQFFLEELRKKFNGKR